MDKISEIKGYAASLGLTYTKTGIETIVHEAEKNSSSYLTFLYDVLYGEIKYRQDKAKERRIKEAGFPYKKYLKDFVTSTIGLFMISVYHWKMKLD